MEEKKLSNQHFEVCGKDFQFSDVEKDNHERVKHYGRDLLLQLRLHPLSLQKPKSLPGMEVIKEKLYLEDINETFSTPADKYMDANSYASMKSEFCNMKYEYPLVPHYFNRAYQYCYYPHGYNGCHQCAPTKLRSSFHSYCNPLKKHCIGNHHYKDFPTEECLWTKRISSSEDVWNFYPSNVPSSLAKKKEAQESVPKSKKKLSIIDPVTGENVLEAVTSNHHDKQNDAQQNSESSESYSSVSSEGKYAGDFFSNPEINEGSTLQISKDAYADSTVFSSVDKSYKLKSSSAESKNVASNRFEDNLKSNDGLCDDKPAFAMNNNKNNVCASAKVEVATSTIEPTKTEDMSESTKISEHINLSGSHKVPHIMCQQQESIYSDKIGNYQAHCMKEYDNPFCKEPVFKHIDSLQESLKLKDKSYSLRQEQQKVAILQSFLRFRKYQLEENARSLDEKRMEIANWECNLFNKTKKLIEKEMWLENKSEMLYNKAQKLAEHEKLFNRGENKSLGDYLPSKSMSKDAEFSEKKFTAFNCSDSDTVFEEIPKIESSYKNAGKNDFSYFELISNSRKSPEDISLDAQKYNSGASSLDNLEEFVENMYLRTDVQEANMENKSETSDTMQKKAIDNSIGYSKGRRYLPEHIKYWLNKQDKSVNE